MFVCRTMTSLGIAVFLACGTAAAQERLYPSMFPLGDIKLLDGPFKQRIEVNAKTLLAYDADRLLQPYLKEAGLPAKGAAFSNWAGLDGHVGGHYLSALAMHYAATQNAQIKTRMDYFLSELKRAQDANGSNPAFAGYLGGVPNGKTMWTAMKGGNTGVVWDYWVPWYNVHKTYAGLRDAWLYTGSETARTMFLKLCDWGLTITGGLSDAQMEGLMGNEYGGMNEVYADAYAMTKDAKYLTAAKRWSHKWLLNAMVAGTDNLDNKHANTQVPKAIGFARVAEVSGDANYTKGAQFFWNTVVNNRSLAIGANSRTEFFPEKSKYNEFVEVREGPETCNSYNMLKLTEDLFRISPQARYADYYERSLFNHVLSSIHPSHGGYVYFTPARPRHYRVYSKVNAAMWCCVGSGMENPPKYAQFAYLRRSDSLYVNLFLASELDWREKGVKIVQTTSFPEEARTRMTVSVTNPTRFKMLVRHPSWVRQGEFKIVVGADTVSRQSSPSSYVTVDRTWNQNDVVTVLMPMTTRVEPLANVANYLAIVHGPIVLGARTGTESMSGLVADEGRWSHIAGGPLQDLTTAPILAAAQDSIASRLVPVAGKPLTFKAPRLFFAAKDSQLVLEPFYKIHDSRYMLYWMRLTNQRTLDSLSAVQQAALLLDGRTVDRVSPGQQQPEVDHQMQQTGTNSGVNKGESYRDGGSCTGGSGASLSYTMATAGESDLTLWVRYWGNESSCTRTFDILVDGQKVATENIAGKWKVDAFVNQEYAIPNAVLAGKQNVTVRFQAATGMLGGIYGVRLLRRTPATEIGARPRGLDGRSLVRVEATATSLVLELDEPVESPTLVRVVDLAGRTIARQVIPAGIQSHVVDLAGHRGACVVQVIRSGVLLQASLATFAP
jgi:DUF1680 family protein